MVLTGSFHVAMSTLDSLPHVPPQWGGPSEAALSCLYRLSRGQNRYEGVPLGGSAYASLGHTHSRIGMFATLSGQD